MGDSIIGTGISGIRAAQLGLATTGHNISNASTVGYTRQETIQAANAPRFTGSGYIGQGVSVLTVRRNYDEFLDNQLRYTQSQASLYDTHYAALKRIDELLVDPQAGLAPAIDAFFGAVQDLTVRPGDVATRQTLLSASQAMVARFRDLDGRLDYARAEANERIRTSVGLITSYSAEIAALNRRIVLATNSGAADHLANDLLDRRDTLLHDLAIEVNASVVKRDDGSVDVFLGNGQVLVSGDRAYQLVTLPNGFDPQDIDVALQADGTTVRLRAADFSGGHLAGYLAFRDTSLTSAQNALGRIGLALGQTFNTQHRLGQDRSGALGADYFSLPPPESVAASTNGGSAVLNASIADTTQVNASDYRLKFDGTGYQLTRLSDNSTQSFPSLPQTIDGLTMQLASGSPAAGDTFEIRATRNVAGGVGLLITDINKIAAAAPIVANAAATNSGSGGVLSIQVNGPTPDPNLLQPVTISFTSPTTFDVSGVGTGNPTGLSFTPGMSISFNGWTAQLGGAPSSGDQFSIGANVGGVGDNRNAVRLAELQAAPVLDGGSATLQGAWARVVSQIGAETRALQVGSEAQANLVQLTLQAQQAASGVNLDEEAANLIRYQQAYQAAGRVIAIAQTLFEELLDIAR